MLVAVVSSVVVNDISVYTIVVSYVVNKKSIPDEIVSVVVDVFYHG
jgi:hypothetical protein